MKKYSIKLEYKELLLIDGKVNSEAQEIIDQTKKEQSYGFDIPKLNEILRESEKSGRLTWMYLRDMNYCPVCKKRAGYAKYTRNSKYHRKGDPNYNRKLLFSGIKFNSGFVRFVGSGDFCDDCIEKTDPVKKLCEYILNSDLKIEIDKNKEYKTKYTKDDKRICYKCKKEMFESEMGNVMTFFGNGTFKGECPHCKARSAMFLSHKTTKEWRMIKKENIDKQC